MTQSFGWMIMSIFDTNTADLYNIIRHLKNKNSSGHDGISNKLMRVAASSIRQLLGDVSNECAQISLFPKSMKQAEVLPLLKNGESSLPDNNRPIGLLTSLSKNFEKSTHKRRTKILEKHKLLTPKHLGFKENLPSAHSIA